jgi:MYXO-CTERM domain-containing protein
VLQVSPRILIAAAVLALLLAQVPAFAVPVYARCIAGGDNLNLFGSLDLSASCGDPVLAFAQAHAGWDAVLTGSTFATGLGDGTSTSAISDSLHEDAVIIVANGLTGAATVELTFILTGDTEGSASIDFRIPGVEDLWCCQDPVDVVLHDTLSITLGSEFFTRYLLETDAVANNTLTTQSANARVSMYISGVWQGNTVISDYSVTSYTGFDYQSPVPEPASALLVLPLLALPWAIRRRR